MRIGYIRLPSGAEAPRNFLVAYSVAARSAFACPTHSPSHLIFGPARAKIRRVLFIFGSRGAENQQRQIFGPARSKNPRDANESGGLF